MKTFKSITYLFIIFFNYQVFAQTPFTTLCKEPRFLKSSLSKDNIHYLSAIESEAVIKKYLDESKTDTTIKTSERNGVDFFKNNGLTLNLLNSGPNRLSGSSQVIYYKLYIANPNEKNYYRINRYNIPLMVISKLSSNYDSINASTSLDVLDYEASPISLRLMPSFKKEFETYSDLIYFGFYADIRGLNLYSPKENNYSMRFIGTGGIGFTFQGDGQAGAYNEQGEYESGRYSVSLILQGATADKELINSLFKTSKGNKDYVGALQGYLIFKAFENSAMNIKIGYQHFFQKTQSGNRSNFSITLGI